MVVCMSHYEAYTMTPVRDVATSKLLVSLGQLSSLADEYHIRGITYCISHVLHVSFRV